MKIVITSDIHLGKYKYGKINNQTGYDLRTEDILNNLDAAINYAIKIKSDYFFILGDFYHTKRPHQIFRKLLASKISKILRNNIEVFLLIGNHDQGKTASHDLIELSEMRDLITKLHVIDQPQSFEFEDSLFCFLPCINKVDLNIKNEDEIKFSIDNIKKFTKEAEKSNKKNKIFLGHFGTDKSQAGKSFDLGTIETHSERVIQLKIFDPKIWSKVYLGDIHKPQEMNDFVRHPGSVARVDFGEEFEEKGFYLYCDGKDEFIKIPDREFKTLEADFTKGEARELMETFCDEIQDLDLSESITRLKIRINMSKRKLINFKGIEDYLKEQSWNYIGKTITEIDDRNEDIIIDNNDDLDHIAVFDSYVDSVKDQMDRNIFDDLKKEGKILISEELNS